MQEVIVIYLSCIYLQLINLLLYKTMWSDFELDSARLTSSEKKKQPPFLAPKKLRPPEWSSSSDSFDTLAEFTTINDRYCPLVHHNIPIRFMIRTWLQSLFPDSYLLALSLLGHRGLNCPINFNTWGKTNIPAASWPLLTHQRQCVSWFSKRYKQY